jgi:hypothetical protein
VRGGDIPDVELSATLAVGGDTGDISVPRPIDDATLAAELAHLTRLAFAETRPEQRMLLPRRSPASGSDRCGAASMR